MRNFLNKGGCYSFEFETKDVDEVGELQQTILVAEFVRLAKVGQESFAVIDVFGFSSAPPGDTRIAINLGFVRAVSPVERKDVDAIRDEMPAGAN